MTTEKINTLIIGAGQAGLAMSEHLGNQGTEHLVLERHRIAENWRTSRWDSLKANGPAWHDRFPSMEFPDTEPDDFPGKETVTKYFESFAAKINAPVRCGVEVTGVNKFPEARGFLVETSAGQIHAENIVCATGPFQHPVIPPVIPTDAPGAASIKQLHSNEYYNPEQLPDGATLVVGSGSSGAQIADELLRSGRDVYLSIGPHERPPRSYRGRDFVWWLGVLGKWDIPAADPDTAHVTIAVSGAYGGKTVDFKEFASRGMTLLGMTSSFHNDTLTFANDLQTNIDNGDRSYLSMLDEADEYIALNGLELPEEPAARNTIATPQSVTDPLLELNLVDENITAVIWATGYTQDFSWLHLDVFDEENKPIHQRGVSPVSGLYFLGLPWLSRRGSSFIWGVWHDAKYLADQINIQRKYRDYRGPA